MCDTNSRTWKINDIINPDELLCHEHNLEFIIDEFNEQESYFQNTNVSLERINSDKGTNSYGYDLIQEIHSMLDTLVGDVTQRDIDTIVNELGSLFTTCAYKTFGSKPRFRNKQDQNKHIWYGKTRRDFHKAKFQYKLRQTEHNETQLCQKCKLYKQTLNKYCKEYKQDKVTKLRKLKKSNSRDYWKIINDSNKGKIDIGCPIEKRYTHFKNIGQSESADERIENDEQINMAINEEINEPITENEILKSVRKLNKNRANGIDLILNEHIHVLLSIMLPTMLNSLILFSTLESYLNRGLLGL
ncbi:MAG: hypothetical protein ABW185_24050 [Sedimenticola sp.]